jgi:hypothetical protein
MSPASALATRLHGGGLLPLLPAQELVRTRLLALESVQHHHHLERATADIARLHARELSDRCVCRNGRLIEPLHHHSLHRHGSQFCNRREGGRGYV